MGTTVFATTTTPGPPGPTGPPGYSPVYIVASGAPSNAVGNNGDMYIDSTNGNVYGPKVSGTWGAIVCNIKGSTGATGAQGPPGYSPVYIVQAGPPGAGIGNDHDMYINSTTSDVYGPKTSGTWGGIQCNIKGATGSQGPPGVAYTPRGAWAAGTTYAQGDEVTSGSQLYISLQPGNVGHDPATSPTWWQPVGSGAAQTPWLSDIDGAGFKLKNTGNVGIGNDLSVLPFTDPNYLQMVVGPNNTSLYPTLTLATAKTPFNAYLQFANYAIAGTEKRVAIIGGTQDGSANSAALQFFTSNAGALGERMRITAAGNVGIGTTAPGNKLVISNAGAGGLEINPSATIGSATGVYMSSYDRIAAAYRDFIFDVTGGSQVVIKAGTGNVGIGTTSPTARSHVKQSSNGLGGGFRLEKSDSTNVFDFVIGADTNLYIQSSTLGICVTPAGSVGFGTGTPHWPVEVFVAGTTAACFIAGNNSGAVGILPRGNIGAIQAYTGVTASGAGPLLIQPDGGNVGIGTSSSYRLDVAGDVNCTGTYRVNGTPLATGGGPTGVTSGGRAMGTVYQNTTGKPMWIGVVLNFTAGNGVPAYCDTSSNPTTQVSYVNPAGAGSWSLHFIALPGYYYRVPSAANVSIVTWNEWT